MKTFKKALAIVLATMMAFSVLAVSVFAEGEANAVITFVDVTVAAPVDGEYATGDWVMDTADAEVTFMQWADYYTEDILFSTDEGTEVVDATFVEGGSYVVGITVTAAEGYEFASENLVLSVNGYAAELVDISEDAKEVSFTCVFDCDADNMDIDDGTGNGSFSFDQVLEFLKSVLMTFVRFIGSIFGYK